MMSPLASGRPADTVPRSSIIAALYPSLGLSRELNPAPGPKPWRPSSLLGPALPKYPVSLRLFLQPSPFVLPHGTSPSQRTRDGAHGKWSDPPPRSGGGPLDSRKLCGVPCF